MHFGFVIKENLKDDIKVKDHCDITGKYRRSADRDCNIHIRLTHKVIFFIMQKIMICTIFEIS